MTRKSITVKQFRKKVDVARRRGYAYLGEDDLMICCSDRGEWVLKYESGNVVDVAWHPESFEYLFD